MLGLPKNLGILIAVGTSICGVTAIVATANHSGKKEEIAYAVSVITVFGILATIGYPYLAIIFLKMIQQVLVTFWAQQSMTHHR